MQFRFSQYQYQTDAADAVCDVFDGQPLQDGVSYIRDTGIRRPTSPALQPAQDTFDIPELRPVQEMLGHFDADDDTGYRNADLLLDGERLLANIKNVQRRQNLTESPKLYTDPAGAVELDVEMETGTGKTFVYTKTMFELNRRYGWSKFIVVVPSIAIREGVAKSLDMTGDYFYASGRDGNEGYGKKLRSFIYDSSNLNRLDEFAQSPDIQVMIINMQAFNTSMKENGRSKDARIIFSERDDFGSRRPIDVISASHPIMILDEPQKMGGKATQAGIRLFKPLFTLNYSATHKTKHDLVYALDALDAYNQRLVKRIEVKGFELNNMRGTDGYLYLQDVIVSKNRAPQARIEYKKLSSAGKVVTTSGLFDEGDDVYTASGGLEAYRDGWRIAPDGIVPDGLEPGRTSYVRFMNGETLGKGRIMNDGSEADMRRVQIREGVRQDRNLLSDADFLDVNLLTVIASESYERFAESLQKDIETDLRERPIVINDAFFAKTCVPADKLGPEYAGLGDVSFSKDEARDIVYALTVDRLIDRDGKLTDKYKEEHFGKDAVELLPEPLRKKVPAIRLVLDSVVEGTTKVLIGNALKRKVHGNPLNANWQKKEFQELWRRINHKYAYTVSFNDDELVKNAVKAIDERLVVSKLSYTVTRGIQKENASRDELADRTHFHRNDSYTGGLDVDASNGVRYDLLGEIAQAATITRRCAARILKSIRPDRFLMFRDNPEQFIARVGRLIVQEKANMVVDHICYDRIEGGYDSSIFTKGGNNRDEAEGYQASKCVQDWVFPDGRIESDFAKDLDNAAEVAVYAKLPRGFQIPTPVGNYAPDWAVAFRDDSGLKHLFFVAETKGSLESFDLRGIENSKIACAKRLFNQLDLADGTRYEQATTYQTLLDEVKALQ